MKKNWLNNYLINWMLVIKRYLFFIGCLLFLQGHTIAQVNKKLRVLFLGNSYTSAYNIPQLVANIASSMNDTLVFDYNTPGGCTFQQHWNNTTSINKIKQGNWDFLVLQEQSQIPAFPDDFVAANSAPFAKKLDSLFTLFNPCAQTVFYMTWGRKNGDASNCAFWPPMCTYQGMDSMLYKSYMQFASNNKAIVAPVGAVWKKVRQQYPAINLYETDGSHPNNVGSFVAASTIYTTLFNKNMNLSNYQFNLTATDAIAVKNLAKETVLDSSSKWYIDQYNPTANFSWQQQDGFTINFNNTSINATHYLWNFGDGAIDTARQTSHVFATANEYPVSLIVHQCGKTDTSMQLVKVVNRAIQNQLNKLDILLVPNPAINSAKIYLKVPQMLQSISIYNTSLQLVQREIINKTTDQYPLQFSLPMGVYFIQVATNLNTSTLKLMVK
jgi:hypothetical protein